MPCASRHGRGPDHRQGAHACLEVWSPCHTARAPRCPHTPWPGWPIAWATCTLRAHPARAAPRRWRWRSAWTRSGRCCWTGCRTGAPAAWWASPRPRSATAWTCCWARWPRSASANPTGPSSPASTTCASGLRRWPHPARRCAWTGWPPGCRGPPAGATRRCCTTPSATPTPPRAWRCRPSTATFCGATVAGRAAATSTSSSSWRGWMTRWVGWRSQACWTAGSGGWPSRASTGMHRSGTAAPQGSTDRRPAGLQPPAGGAARAGGAGDRPSGQRLGVAPLARAAVPRPARLPGRRRAHLPRPLAPRDPHMTRASRTPSMDEGSGRLDMDWSSRDSGDPARPWEEEAAAMVDLHTGYLRLALRSPLVASASPLTGSLDDLRRLENAGAGAVVLPSLFQEQLTEEARVLTQGAGLRLGRQSLQRSLARLGNYNTGPEGYLTLVQEAKAALDIPV